MPADRPQQKARRRAKVASLSSHLLVRDDAPGQKGFVIPFQEARVRRGSDSPAEQNGAPPSLPSRHDKTVDQSVERSGPAEAAQGTQLLVRALREGDLAKAERIFANISELAPHTARRVFHGTSGHDLAIACRALGLDQLQFVSILILSRKLGEDDPAGQPEQLAAAIETYEQHRPTAARELLSFWRRDGLGPEI